MKSIKIKTLIYSLLVLIILLSAYLIYADSIGSKEGVCLIKPNGNSRSCSDVQNSPYGKLFGIKLSHFGLAAFLLLLMMFIYSNYSNKYERQVYRLFVLFSFIGSLLAIYFLYIQFFILKTLCSSCIIIDVTMAVIFFLSIVEYKGRWRAPLV